MSQAEEWSTVQRLDGKVVIVTGGTSGIGKAAAELFAARGAAVVVSGRRAERGATVARRIRDAGGEAHFVAADVCNADSVGMLMEETLRIYGQLDCAFNNAGVPGVTFADTSQQSEASWDEVINTNLKGIWLCMKHELRHLGPGGAIVNTASIFAHAGSDFGIAPYTASKHGVIGLTRAAAVEFAKSGIRVNAISPGMTLTEMTAPGREAAPEAFDANIRQGVPLGRIAQPKEIAEAAVWLCSDAASYVTGAVFCIDGGWLAR